MAKTKLDGNKAIINIDGENIIYHEIKEIRTIPLKDYVEKVALQVVNIKTPILPKGCVMFERVGELDNYYINFPLGKYHFNSKERQDDGKIIIKRRELVMPNTIIKFTYKGNVLRSHRIGWSFRQDINFKFKTWHLIDLPNIYKGSSRTVCLGSSGGGATPKASIENFVKAYFLNVFNHDLTNEGFTMKDIGDDQIQMQKDGKSPEEIMKRLLYRYDKEKQRIVNRVLGDSFMRPKIFSDYFGG